MAYQANRGTDNQVKSEKQRNDENNAKNIKNAADVAIASKNPYAVAAGSAVKAADKITGGRSTKALGKAMTKANQYSPVGKKVQDASNKLSESGASDKIGQVAQTYNGAGGAPGGGAPGAGGAAGATPTSSADTAGAANKGNAGGGQDSSLPSSDESTLSKLGQDKSENNKSETNQTSSESGSNQAGSSSTGDFDFTQGALKFIMKDPVKVALLFGLPIVFALSFLAIMIVNVVEEDSKYEDALAASTASGGPTGYTQYNSTNDEFRDYIQRVIAVTGDDGTDEYTSSVDSPYLIVTGTVHIIMDKDGTYTYKYFTKGKLRKIKKAIEGDEVQTKTNLANDIFPKYFENLSQAEYESLADQVFDYVKNYYSYIGYNKTGGTCDYSSTSSCTYGIKGFYINGKGNVKEKLNLNKVKVRIMDCDNRKKELSGEELVDFEKYILGVAYAENDGAPEEGFKAQLVAARSYILARHADIGGKIKQEGENYIIEAVSCTKDQVYCDPDKGCSQDGNNMRSGTEHTLYKKALSSDHKYRSYAKEVEGQLVLNDQGYVVYTTYVDTTQKKFNSLAKSGKDYKEILLSIYNKATDISQPSCTQSSACSTVGTAASGNYTTWKQADKIWGSVPLGNSSTNIARSGCTITSIAMQIKRSGVDTSKVPGDFNPGTFVTALNKIGGFSANGGIKWNKVTELIPDFKYVTTVDVSGKTQEEKLSKIKELVGKGYYIIAEVKGATPNSQHWVAIDQVQGDKITMMDPASSSKDMWKTYNPSKTTYLACYKA